MWQLLSVHSTTVLNLILSIVAGSLIGLERTFQGHPAGLRTHLLVCLAACLLMQLTVVRWPFMPGLSGAAIRIDPTRVVQGVMTGIGFLGAGVIIQTGDRVRGLTTAASIWINSAIGIMIGASLYVPAFATIVLALGTLSLLRHFESIIPTVRYAWLTVRCRRENTLSDTAIRDLVRQQGFGTFTVNYALVDEGRFLEYDIGLRTRDENCFAALAAALAKEPKVLEFRLAAR
jgi:putative Mg2+ transporter-C (MgtC) family protein